MIGHWWFSTEEWPPKDYNYDEELEKRGLREVTLSRWQEEEEFDSKVGTTFGLYVYIH